MTNALVVPAEFNSARLPAIYEQAKNALAQCERIDECKDWADKYEALASYARQAKDDELRHMADRIQARAIRQCGELLKAVPAAPAGRPAEIDRAAPTDFRQPGRFQAAADAGLSRDQAVTALRVANVPADQFEAAVESETPPTVTQLAELGTIRRIKSELPSPKNALERSRNEGGSLIIASDGKYHQFISDDQKSKNETWLILKDRLWPWLSELEPSNAVNSIPTYQLEKVHECVASIERWLPLFKSLLEKGK